MKRNITSKTCRFGLCAGLALCSAAMAPAAITNATVNFQVDMTQAITDGQFVAGSDTMAARGSFNNWTTPLLLTNNPSGPSPNLWTGTTNVNLASGVVMAYKYTIQTNGIVTATGYEGGHNRLITLTNNTSTTVPKAYWGDPLALNTTVSVKFQVDMAQQINTGAFDTNTATAYARGGFNGWSTDSPMTNDPTIFRTNQFGLVTSNVYVFTRDVIGTAGQTFDFKYEFDPGSHYEAPTAGTGDPGDNNNRFFNVANAVSQTLPIVYFSDAPFAPLATNDVTFQVDMSSQILVNNFDPSTGTVEVRGDFNGWAGGANVCTNNPSAPNTNIYTTVVRIADGIGATRQYKFWASVTANGGYELEGQPNRSFSMVSRTAQILPVVLFSDIYNDPADYLPVDTSVTFSVNMTNAVGTDSHVFDPANDTVHINGVPTFVATWDNTLPQLTNNPVGSKVYSLQFLLPKGSPVQQTYKYSINGADNEAGFAQNHVRYIRQTGTYTLPLDTFGNQYVEPSFGQLAIGAASGGTVPVSWLGRPGVHLQTKADLTSGSWQDLSNTDGSTWANGYSSTNGFVSVTNYPTSSAKTFFRLIKQ